MKWEKFYKKIQNSQNNVRFDDMVGFLNWLKFDSRQRRSSHKVFTQPHITEIINMQNNNGEVDSYQIRQALAIIEKYNLM